ncbi:MAG TPA: type II toxin-antitoxin system VapC family toxin [Stellaceae bacterium]
MRTGEDSGAVLLDTCAVIWLANGNALDAAAVAAIIEAGLAEGIFVSPVSAWEIGRLSRPGRRAQLRFLPDPKTWFERIMAAPGIREAPFSGAIAIDASYLPGAMHGDPGDRLLISTARHLGAPIVTRDRRIIDYAEGGHVGVIRC